MDVMSRDFLDLDNGEKYLLLALEKISKDFYVPNAVDSVESVGGTQSQMERLVKKRYLFPFENGLLIIPSMRWHKFLNDYQGKMNEQDVQDLLREHPTYDDVKMYACSNGFECVVDSFFNYYSSTNWKTKNGRPIVDWKKALSGWYEWERNKNQSFNTKEFARTAINKTYEEN